MGVASFEIERDRAVYDPYVGMLYIGYGDGTLDACEEIEDTPSGAIVMYRSGAFAGVEIPSDGKFVFPLVIPVDARVPFEVTVPNVLTV